MDDGSCNPEKDKRNTHHVKLLMSATMSTHFYRQLCVIMPHLSIPVCIPEVLVVKMVVALNYIHRDGCGSKLHS